MEAVSVPVAEEEQRANRLRLVQFYVPRLLAADGHDPQVWVYALALHQLSEDVLLPYRVAHKEPLAADLLLSLQTLRRLGEHLHQHFQAPPLYWQQEAENWQKVQLFLLRALPLVERVLAAGVAEIGDEAS